MKKLSCVLALLLVLAVALSRPARAACFQLSLALCDANCRNQDTECRRGPYAEQYCVDSFHDCGERCVDENCPDGIYYTY